VKNNDDTAIDQYPIGTDKESPPYKFVSRRPSNTYTLRIEHIIHSMLVVDVSSSADKPLYLARNLSITEAEIKPSWSREFTVLGRNTLEQLNEIILHILGWDRNHLYEFRIADRLYAHMVFLEEDDLFVVAGDPIVSCDIRIRHLGLSIGDVFTYIFHFGNYHTFRLTLLDIRPPSTTEAVPALLSYQGKNIIQYPDIMSKVDAIAFGNKAPTIVAPEPARDRFRVRFITDADESVLREWRASNNKTHWQKAVTILENRSMSLENIAKKIERSEGNVKKWIQVFNRFGLEGLTKPDGHRGSVKLKGNEKRKASRELKTRRIIEIVHAKPSTYGINRSNWNRPSIVRAYEREHKETISIEHAGYLLRQSGFTIRKARKVLTSPDPNYREKVDLLLDTLQNLRSGELLFFVDELGPLRVKKYGGRALVRKYEALTYPQEQAHRGIIMMSGALSATTNQMTWLYGSAKDTSAMIDLMELLYNQYF
jgi:transposase